jgi:LPXTG-site transpeptidase (sortase) family protein
LNKNSMRLILIGILLLLLVSLRIITTSANLEDAPNWEQGDQEGVAQVLATVTARASLAQTQTPPTANSGQQITQQNSAATPGANPILGTTEPQNTASGANASNGEVFLAPRPTGERIVEPGNPGIPVRIIIPAVGIDAPVIPSKSRKILIHADVFEQWVAPDMFAAGWITASALLGEKGNTVISGHHNDFGEVFGRLVDVNVGDTILVFSEETILSYKVTNRMILKEVDVPDDTRIQNARWIGHSDDERLTLVTCWPADSNTHRLILVAVPEN